ncbi:MAG: beta-propeller domain-containing protein [Patescibacteria group bacterium]|jgi:uncharacterized secreted protein with C-terminal beta-propeller domain
MNTRGLIYTLSFAVVVVAGLLYSLWADPFGLLNKNENANTAVNLNTNTSTFTEDGIQAFTSAEEFRSYLASAPSTSTTYSLAAPRAALDGDFVVEDIGTTVGLGTSELAAPDTQTVERVSETNVQVQGIDEPDIVKTDGTTLFLSQEDYFSQPFFGFERQVAPLEGDAIAPEFARIAETKSVTVFPIEDLEEAGSVEDAGDLLLIGSNLMVLKQTGITAYDVSDPTTFEKQWTLEYDNGQYLETARMFDGKLYLITRQYVDRITPCPLEPFILDGEAFVVPCDTIFHPVTPVTVDATYTAAIIDPATGAVQESISFVGEQSSSTIYMSPNALYVFFTQYQSQANLLLDFVLGEGASVFPQSVRTDLERVQGYDISDQAKEIEFSLILEDYFTSLTPEEEATLQNTYQDLFEAYLEKRAREFVTSGIVKISLDSFTVAGTGEVPGYLLNQFSVDEYNGNLRVATTSDANLGGASVNDVYILDKDLKTIGSVLDLGVGERIYSARFIGDKGYVVTFRQIDPFYVLDLSIPTDPKKTGELKIPGFSSYLDPLTENLVLGVGEASGQTKLSLFNVADPENPIEAANFNLDAYWSGVSESHHAFLHDATFSAFFLPAGEDGYIFSYTDDGLTLEKVVEDVGAQRAIYVNENLYVVGSSKIVVLDEKTWEEVASLSL